MSTNNATTVSAALNEDLFNFVEDYRWSNRKKRSEILVEAIEDWAIRHGFDAETVSTSPPD